MVGNIVISVIPPFQIVIVSDRRITGRVVFITAAWQALNQRIHVRPQKIWDGIACLPLRRNDPVGVEAKRPLVQRWSISPEFTTNDLGTWGTSNQSPDFDMIWSPGTPDWAKKVMKLASV